MWTSFVTLVISVISASAVLEVCELDERHPPP